MKAASRQTEAKKAIKTFLEKHTGPISENELRQALVDKGFRIHKTTIYRQLESLVALGWADITHFSDGVARYERQVKHHHHVVCRTCKRVAEVHLKSHLSSEERQIAKFSGFTNVTHALEFFGTCIKCSH